LRPGFPIQRFSPQSGKRIDPLARTQPSTRVIVCEAQRDARTATRFCRPSRPTRPPALLCQNAGCAARPSQPGFPHLFASGKRWNSIVYILRARLVANIALQNHATSWLELAAALTKFLSDLVVIVMLLRDPTKLGRRSTRTYLSDCFKYISDRSREPMRPAIAYTLAVHRAR
jgi:hypothetical protein